MTQPRATQPTLASEVQHFDSPKTLLAIPSCDERGLEAEVSSHFGHAPCFTFVELHADGSLSATSVANPYAEGHAPGQVPAFLGVAGANVILTRGIGKGAIMHFRRFGIDALGCTHKTVEEAVRAYLQGELKAPEPCSGRNGCQGHLSAY